MPGFNDITGYNFIVQGIGDEKAAESILGKDNYVKKIGAGDNQREYDTYGAKIIPGVGHHLSVVFKKKADCIKFMSLYDRRSLPKLTPREHGFILFNVVIVTIVAVIIIYGLSKAK